MKTPVLTIIIITLIISNRSVEEVLSHVSFQPQSISRIHPSFLSLLTKSHKHFEATSFSQYSLQWVPKEILEVGAQQQQQIIIIITTIIILIIYRLIFIEPDIEIFNFRPDMTNTDNPKH